MISWIQRTFQRHFGLVITVILLAMAVPLIVVFTPSSGIGQGGPKSLDQPFFGYNLNRAEDATLIRRDAELSAILRRQMIYDESQLVQYAYVRVAGLAVADELKLPQPTKAEIEAYTAKLPAFLNEQGAFDQTVYQRFGDSLKAGGRFTMADANRVLRADARLEKVETVIGGPGYVVPAEVANVLSRVDSSWSTQIATLDYATFDPAIAPSDDAVAKFFEDNSFRYVIPDRARLSMVRFNSAEFIPGGSATEEQLRAYYEANPARFPVPPDADKKDSAPNLQLDAAAQSPSDNFPKVRDQVEAAFRNDVGLVNAQKAANAFTLSIYESKATANSTELAAFLASRGLTTTPLPAFSPDNPPADLQWLGSHFEQIARLGEKRHFSDPLRSPEGFVVLLWNDTLPSYKPDLSEVRDRVVADYKDSEKRKRFVERGQALRTQLQATVKSGTAFETAAADAGLEIKSFENFTLIQRPQDFPPAAVSVMANLKAGQISEMVSTGDKGHLIFAKSIRQPDLSESNPRYAEIRDRLMRETASSNAVSYLLTRIEAELKASDPTATP